MTQTFNHISLGGSLFVESLCLKCTHYQEMLSFCDELFSFP